MGKHDNRQGPCKDKVEGTIGSTATGAAIGAVVGGPPGALIGGIVGAIVGARTKWCELDDNKKCCNCGNCK